MKNLAVLLILAISFVLGRPAHAQQSAERLRTQSAEATRKLAAQISLDDARMIQVRRLTHDRLAQEAEVAQMYSNDPVMQQNKLRVINQAYAEKLQGVLTELQYKRYLALIGAPAPATLPAAAIAAAEITPTTPAKPAADTVTTAPRP